MRVTTLVPGTAWGHRERMHARFVMSCRVFHHFMYVWLVVRSRALARGTSRTRERLGWLTLILPFPPRSTSLSLWLSPRWSLRILARLPPSSHERASQSIAIAIQPNTAVSISRTAEPTSQFPLPAHHSSQTIGGRGLFIKLYR